MFDHTCNACKSLLLNLSDFDFQQVSQQVYQWNKVDKKVQKTSMNVSSIELVEMFNSQIQTLKKHIFVKREQNKFYNHLKEHLEENTVIVHVDYSENYSNKEQQEIQSAYFGHETFSIFTACCYFRGHEGKLKTKNVTIIRVLPHILASSKYLKRLPRQCNQSLRFMYGVMDVLLSSVHVLCFI